MGQTEKNGSIIHQDDLILVTGAGGFIGSRLVENLLDRGFRNLRCFARPSSSLGQGAAVSKRSQKDASVEVFRGNLLSPDDCIAAMKDVAVVYHLAAGRGEKSFPDAYLNSVVTTRNLLEAGRQSQSLKRFVNISSFSVYANTRKPHWRLLDESCRVEDRPQLRGDAYCFAKVKQDEIVAEYGKEYELPYVIVRPGYVYGPGKKAISGRVGLDTFGVFLNLGGGNQLPLTYVDNCADAIALAGLKPGLEGEVFNVVDDDLPTSRKFLRLYKKNVKKFRSIYVPHSVSFALCYLWERYSAWSQGQLDPVFNRRMWHAYWKTTRYSNEKLKRQLGWTPKVSMAEGMQRFFEGCRDEGLNA
jgi:nucleoside-diphosphate-sugar epimerase